MIPVCFSDWVYLNKTASVAAANTDEVTVTIHTRTQSSNVETSKPVPTDPVKDPNEPTFQFTESTGFFPKPTYNIDDWYQEEIFVKSESSFSQEKTTETIVSYFKRKRIADRSSRNSGSFVKPNWTHTYTVAWYTWTSTITKTRELPVDSVSSYSLKVNKGNTISPCDLPIDNYKQYSYFADNQYSTLFDFTKPINSNKDIYLKYYEGDSSLTQFINGKTSGTYSIYDSGKGGSAGQFDVSSDSTYETKVGCDYLSQATIVSGVTINITYSDNQLFPTSKGDAIADGADADKYHRDTNSNVALDYYNNQYIGNNNCSTMIRLLGDLTVKGNLGIGARVGGVNSNTHFSEIIGNYTQLDLNGHNLIIDGGKVECYGSILDRTGGGKVIVKNGGTIMGLLTVTDARGGNLMTYGYGKGQSPFDEYRFAYIEAPIVAYYGTTVMGYLKLDLGSLGISIIKANIIGTSSNGVFSWGTKKTDEDCFEIIPYINKSLYPSSISNPKYKSVYTMMYYYRYKFNFKANIVLNSQIPLNATVNVLGKDTPVKIDWARIGVPIPPFFDFKLFDDYSMTLKAKLLLLPGSSFITAKNSNLIFDPGENVKYEDIQPSTLFSDIVIKGETKRNCGSIMAYDRSFYSYYSYDNFNAIRCGINNDGKDSNGNNYSANNDTSVFWSYPEGSSYRMITKPSNHMILGKVTIGAMPDSNKYLISGPISLSKQALQTIISSQYVKTYDIKGEQMGSMWFGIKSPSSEASYNLITSFNTLPLISNGKAFIKDNNMNINGIFDEETRLFTAGDQTYFLWTPNDYLIGGSDKGNQKALTDYTVTPTLVESVIGNQIIKANGAYYLFYRGIFVPVLDAVSSGTTYTTIKANLRKFCSNNNSKLNGNTANFDSVQMNYDSTNKSWKSSKLI